MEYRRTYHVDIQRIAGRSSRVVYLWSCRVCLAYGYTRSSEECSKGAGLSQSQQLEVVETFVKGRDVFAVLPTGYAYGKIVRRNHTRARKREGLVASRPEHNMLQSLPVILFSNSQKLSLLFFQFLPIILKFLPATLILCKPKMKPHTVLQQKSHCTCRKGVITGDSYRYLCWMNLGCWHVSYESYTPPFVHAYHVVPA